MTDVTPLKIPDRGWSRRPLSQRADFLRLVTVVTVAVALSWMFRLG